MEDPLDNLEVAKLAAVLSGQLRRIDKETESSIPANRIDLRKFQQQVVNSANPNARVPVTFGNFQNQDEARMLEFLNREALNKVPELIPIPPVNNPPVINQQPQQDQNIQSEIPINDTSANVYLPKQTSDDYISPENTSKVEIDKDIFLNYLESIDSSLKKICNVLTTDNKKNKEPLKKNKYQTTNKSNQPETLPKKK